MLRGAGQATQLQGGVLPPDNGFGLLSLTTTRVGTFQAQRVTKTGAPLRWWWGDGTFSDGNVPSKVYPDNSEKTIYVATTDGWSGLTFFHCSHQNITDANVSVEATSLQILYLHDNQLTTPPDVSNIPDLVQLQLQHNQLTTPPDVSNNPDLIFLRMQFNQLTTPPDVSNNPKLQILYLYNNQLTTTPDVSNNPDLYQLHLINNQLTTPPDISHLPNMTHFSMSNNLMTIAPDVSNNSNLVRMFVDENLLPQAQLDTIIDQCWQNRVALGGRSCQIQLQSNAAPPGATAIAQIEGTGIYAGDGLKDNGCIVTY